MKSFTKIILIVFITVSLSNCIKKVDPKPPVADIVPKQNELHGTIWTDNYDWLKMRGNQKVIDYLKAENRYTDEVMEDYQSIQNKLFNEMISRIKETDVSVPYHDGDYFYYYRTEEGKQYKVYCRKKGSLEAEEEIILDENELSEGKSFFSIDEWQVSPDGQILAYALDTTGREIYTVYFKDLESGQLIDDKIENAYADFEWGNDNKTILYTAMDETLRPYRVMLHELGWDHDTDQKVYEDNNGKFWVELYKSKSKEYIFVLSSSSTSSEVSFIKADQPKKAFALINNRQPDILYTVFHHEDEFIILTNENAKNFKIMRTSINRCQRKHWREMVLHDPAIRIDYVDVFKDYMVIYQHQNGLKEIRTYNFKDNSTKYVDFDESVYTYSSSDNYVYDSDKVRYEYSSLVSPPTVIDYDMKEDKYEVLKIEEVPGYDKSQYTTVRVFAKADDGVNVPITLLYKNDLVKDGNNPMILYGYGSYGYTTEPKFRAYLFSLVDRGFIYAYAHVRGSGIMGRQWYEDGKLLKKGNTFTDYISCAEYLISENYTNSSKLVTYGGSAGGLLVGAVINMRPDLFFGAVAGVPFVDVINTMLDESIPLTVMEYEEWGNPNEKVYFDYMMSYSPYDNVTHQAYPNILITAGLYDPRVQYFEPAKWTAKLRAMKTDKNLLLLKTNMSAGHGGASGRYDSYNEMAFNYAFILKIFNIED